MFKTTPPKDTMLTDENMHQAAINAGVATRAAVENIGATTRQLYNSASDNITHAADNACMKIRNNPLQMTAAALGVGFLLGCIFRR